MSTSADIETAVESIKREADIFAKVKLLTRILKEQDIRIKDMALRLGVKSAYICHLIRLNKLPDVIIDGYYSKDVNLSHLFIISRLKDKDSMIKVYEKVLGETLTVKKTEELVRDILYGVKSEGTYLTPEEKNSFIKDVVQLKKNFAIEIIQTRIKSRLTVEVKGSLEDTSKILRDLMKNLQAWQQ